MHVASLENTSAFSCTSCMFISNSLLPGFLSCPACSLSQNRIARKCSHAETLQSIHLHLPLTQALKSWPKTRPFELRSSRMLSHHHSLLTCPLGKQIHSKGLSPEKGSCTLGMDGTLPSSPKDPPLRFPSPPSHLLLLPFSLPFPLPFPLPLPPTLSPQRLQCCFLTNRMQTHIQANCVHGDISTFWTPSYISTISPHSHYDTKTPIHTKKVLPQWLRRAGTLLSAPPLSWSLKKHVYQPG